MKLLIVDGNSIVNRAFFGIQTKMSSSGIPTNAVYGFLKMLISNLEEVKPDYLVVCFDEEGPTFRHLMFKEYKGTRKGMPEELAVQMPILQDLLEKMQVLVIKKQGIEADDLIGTITKRMGKEGIESVIMSGDRDLFQLLDDKISLKLFRTSKAGTQRNVYRPEDYEKEYGLKSSLVCDLKGLMGDSSDNIPGVKGVGEKTAVELLQKFGSLENLYNNLSEVTKDSLRSKLINDKENAFMSKTLATINTEVEIEFDKNKAVLKNGIRSLFKPEAVARLKELSINSLYYFNSKSDLKRNNIIIGITGGIGCGKSFVSDVLRNIVLAGKNVLYLGCDEICKGFYEKGSKVLTSLVELLGKDILDDEGNLIKENMARVIYSDEQKRLASEKITHKAVIDYIDEKLSTLSQETKYVIIESALMFRAELDKKCNITINVTAPIDLRISRLEKNRGLSLEKIESIIKAQENDEKTYSKADYCINNGYVESDENQLSLFDFMEETKKTRLAESIASELEEILKKYPVENN
ncbi:MAG: dephospho-CoA kinase [Lachnospiraceae bacterium]|nr:dephospho-CoA kinase [Lachnospiraceae bacterium]